MASEMQNSMGFQGILVEVTGESRLAKEQRDKTREYLLEYDAMTGIYNRKAFFKHAFQWIQREPDCYYAIITWNISKFKIINELYGMETGDSVLSHLAEAISEFVGAAGVCGRLNADNFVACLPMGLLHPEAMMKDLHNRLFQMHPELHLELCAGIYEVKDKAVTVNLMCDRANMALNTIKGNYLRHFAYYDDSMKNRMLEEQRMMHEMQAALAQGEFCFFLQPLYSLTKQSAVSAEALVRWRHPTRGLISPGAFIPLAERSGFITQIDLFVWESVCNYISQRKAQGLKVVPISVNLSRLNFYVPDLSNKIYAMTQQYGVTTSELRFEITESAYMEDSKRMTELVAELRALGFRVLMDDFGSEYSSLNMLTDIRVDVLKIDMRFLEDFDRSSRAANVVTSVVRMAKWLDTDVVAEGVETQTQMDFLRSIGCDLIQGYYYAAPMETEAFEQLLEDSIPLKNEMPVAEITDFDVEALFNNREVNFLFNGMLQGSVIYEMVEDHLEVLRVNEGYYEMMGTQPELVFRDTRDAFTHVFPDDREKLLNACRTARSSSRVEPVMIRHYSRTGAVLWLNMKLRWVGNKGDRAILFAFLEDVTEQKNFEAQKILQNALDAIKFAYSDILELNFEQGICRMLYSQKKHFSYLENIRDPHEVMKQMAAHYIHPKDRDRYLMESDSGFIWNQLQVSGKNFYQAEFRMRDYVNGDYYWVMRTIIPVSYMEGSASYLFCFTDIQEQKEAQQELHRMKKQRAEMIKRSQSELYRILTEDSKTTTYDLDVFTDQMSYSVPLAGGRRKRWSVPRFHNFIQQSPLIHRDDLRSVRGHLQRLMSQPQRGEMIYRADYQGCGSYRWCRDVQVSLADEAGTVYRIIGRVDDITEEYLWCQRKEQDGLTGLLSRESFEGKVNGLLRNEGFEGALFLFDMDNFKDINEICGVMAGDELLRSVAQIFVRSFRDVDLKARIDGDKLAVLTIGPMSEAMIRQRAEEILEAVRVLPEILHLECPVTLSIGIACIGEDSWTFEQLYQKAEDALYWAREKGKNQYHIEDYK